jgi:putative glutamine amidotransferase
MDFAAAENARSVGRPVVGIGAHTGPVKIAIFDKRATFVAEEFVDRLYAVGCAPVLLPPLPGSEHVVPRLDGLFLLPGPDVDPASYSAERHPAVKRVDAERDAAEFALIDAALGAEVPILAVCRGMQLLNVFRKGTLHQHLPDIIGNDGHLTGPEAYEDQRIRMAPGSRLAAVLGETTVVPCHHHQAIDQLGVGLTATAWASDGTIEALEVPDHPFAVGVQWHTEQSPDDRLYHAFAEAARAMSRRTRG